MNNGKIVRLCKPSTGCAIVGALGLMLATPAFADTDADIAALKQQLLRQQAQIEALLQAQEAQKVVNAKIGTVPGIDQKPSTVNSSSSITYYGIADVGVSTMKSGAGTKFNVGTGGWLASRLGIKGQRDLGGGYKAIGLAEAGILYDTGSVGNGAIVPGINNTNASTSAATTTGNQIFSRQIYAGLTSASGGSLTIGRQYSGSYGVATYGSALLSSGYGYSGGLIPVNGMPTRANNSITYFTPTIAGITGQVLYTTGSENNTSGQVVTAAGATTKTNDKAGRGYDLALTYALGPVYAAVSGWNIYNTSYAVGETGLARKRGWQVAGSYDFGFIKIVGTYSGAKIAGDNYENVTKALSKTSAWSSSFSVPFGKSRAYATYTNFNDESALNRDTKLYGVAYTYDLYENTKLYAAWGRQANNHNASYSLADGGNLTGNVTKPGTAVVGTLAGVNIIF